MYFSCCIGTSHQEIQKVSRHSGKIAPPGRTQPAGQRCFSWTFQCWAQVSCPQQKALHAAEGQHRQSPTHRNMEILWYQESPPLSYPRVVKCVQSTIWKQGAILYQAETPWWCQDIQAMPQVCHVYDTGLLKSLWWFWRCQQYEAIKDQSSLLASPLWVSWPDSCFKQGRKQ